MGISIINGFIFSISISIIVAYYQIKLKEQLLLLSVPSLFFMFIPYTEALFFLFGTILILGLNKNNLYLITTGLLLSSMVRPSAYVFIPAIFVMEYITKENVASFLKRSIYFSFITLLGLFTTVFIQYLYTHKWFIFFDAQKSWDNSFRIPHLPFTSWSGGNIVRLDGTALLVGLIAIGAVIRIATNYFKTTKSTIISKTFLFSLLYLSGMALIVLLFRGGSLFSLNRFIFASPYFIVCFFFFLKTENFKLKNIYLLFIGLSLYWLLFASYVHIQTIAKYELISLFILLPFLLLVNNKTIKAVSFYSFISINIALQLYFMYRFLNYEWVG